MKRKGKSSKADPYALKDLSPCPGFKDGLIERVNKKLSDEKTGNYLISIKKVGEQFKTWIDYEYHSDITVHIIDQTKPDRVETDLLVPGLGANGIDLNTNRKVLPNNFWTWDDFEDQVFDRLLRLQKCINEEGYYAKPKKE